MKIVYIAGPYRADNHWQIECNIHRARQLGATIAQLGAAPLIPHANTAQCPDDFWLEAGLEMLRRCDAVALVEGWARSQGTLAEIKEAERLGLPVFPPLRDSHEARWRSFDIMGMWLGGELDDDETRAACLAIREGRLVAWIAREAADRPRSRFLRLLAQPEMPVHISAALASAGLLPDE